MSGLQVVSLFAGVGGIDLAAHRAGMTTRLLCEKDEACRRVLARHYPDAVIHPDVTELTTDDIRAAGAVPDRTVLTAGWPCQGNSVAGRRGGMADARSGLWAHVARLLDEFRPRWFLGENVPGLLSVNDGRDFATVVQDLAELRYGFAWRVLDAQFFGVPQRRRRVVIVGCLGDSGAASVEVLLEPEGGGGDSSTGRAAGQGVAATLTAGVSRTGVSAPGRRQEDDVNLVVAPLLEVGARTGSSTDDPRAGIGIGALGDPMFTLQAGKQHGVGILGDIAHALTAEGADAREDGTGRGTPIIATCLTAREAKGPDSDVTTNLVVSALDTQQGGPDDNAAQGGHLIAFAWQAGGNNDSSGAFKDDGTTPCLPRSQTLAVAFAENQRGEVTTKPVADSLKVGGGKPGQGYPAALTTDAVRRLTPLECERLQGFPDNWTEGQSDSARYKQMGNSVAVPVFTWVLRRLEAVA